MRLSAGSWDNSSTICSTTSGSRVAGGAAVSGRMVAAGGTVAGDVDAVGVARYEGFAYQAGSSPQPAPAVDCRAIEAESDAPSFARSSYMSFGSRPRVRAIVPSRAGETPR